MMCVAQTQLYQCCCLPDGPLNHQQLLKYHGNFCKCRNVQHSTMARFQLAILHRPCSFALPCSAAPLLSSGTPEAAAWAPAEPGTLWALQSHSFTRAWVVTAAHYKAHLHSLSLCRCTSPASPSACYKWDIPGEAASCGQEAHQCQLRLP